MFSMGGAPIFKGYTEKDTELNFPAQNTFGIKGTNFFGVAKNKGALPELRGVSSPPIPTPCTALLVFFFVWGRSPIMNAIT